MLAGLPGGVGGVQQLELAGSGCAAQSLSKKSRIDESLTVEPITTCVSGSVCGSNHGIYSAETPSVRLCVQSQSVFTPQISPCTVSGEQLCFGGMVSLAWACLCAKGNGSQSNLAV